MRAAVIHRNYICIYRYKLLCTGLQYQKEHDGLASYGIKFLKAADHALRGQLHTAVSS